MEIYKDIHKMREDFFKNFNLGKVKEILKDVNIKKFPVVDNLNDEQILKLIKIVRPKEKVLKIFEKYKLNVENLEDFEDTILKFIEGKEIDIDDDKLDIFEIIFRIYGIPFTAVWKVIKDDLDLSKYDENSCPICGGTFDYAYLDEEGKKFLVCDLCRFPWRFTRIKCPYCGNEEQNKLFYFQFENDYDFVRVYKCENCNEMHKVLLIDKIKNYPSVEDANIETAGIEYFIKEKESENNN